MTVMGAFIKTCGVLGVLRSKGVRVTLLPSLSRDTVETVEKYDKEGRLPPSLWFHAKLQADEDAGLKAVNEGAEELAREGIGFDTGGSCAGGGRDWELDWSFRVDNPSSAGMQNMAAGRKVVEESLRSGEVPV